MEITGQSPETKKRRDETKLHAGMLSQPPRARSIYIHRSTRRRHEGGWRAQPPKGINLGASANSCRESLVTMEEDASVPQEASAFTRLPPNVIEK